MKIQIALAGAVIGFLAGGFLGAIIGFGIGLYVEYVSKDEEKREDFTSQNFSRNERPNYQENDFSRALLILIAATMNADGVTMKSELDMVKRMLIRTYGESRTKQMLLTLRELVKQHHDIAMVCRQIRMRMAYSQRLELLHVLFRISNADGDINASELQLLTNISVQLGISSTDFHSLRAMFVSTPDAEYKILDVAVTANEEEVKKAYRKMAMRFHPDRLLGLGEAEKKAAQEKFVKVQKAYDTIKKKRGWT
ncbi:MAG: TerB family tellurite resistance protein [Bacteroidetes bacterium]|nr:TerB family tellurite resistance protein [Bacteroidota bacterium]